MSNEFTPIYDLDSLNEPQRQDYVRALCKHLGVPPELNLVMLTYIDSSEGPRRLVPYAKRGAAEIIRNTLKIDVVGLTHTMVGGSIVFTATGKNAHGRQEMATGSKYIQELVGDGLDDAIVTAQTRAIRRMTLQFIGSGVLDESEVTNRGVTLSMKSETVQTPAPQPTVQPSAEPGIDFTKMAEDMGKASAAAVEEDLAKVRAQAIAQLNQQTEAEKPEPKPRRKYTRKKVDLGPSEPVPTVTTVVKTEPVVTVTTPPVPQAAVTVEQPIVSTPPSAPSKPALTHEQVKPYRTRLFTLTQTLEATKLFNPVEGMGNSQKMKNLAGIMFDGVSDFKQLTIEQWEKYLSALENKLKTDGAESTIKYIEETIGL